jgi:hypothetical protein
MGTFNFYDAELAKAISTHERGLRQRKRLVVVLEAIGCTLITAAFLVAAKPALAAPRVDPTCVAFVERALLTLAIETGLRPKGSPAIYCHYQPAEQEDKGYTAEERSEIDDLFGVYAMGDVR